MIAPGLESSLEPGGTSQLGATGLKRKLLDGQIRGIRHQKRNIHLPSTLTGTTFAIAGKQEAIPGTRPLHNEVAKTGGKAKSVADGKQGLNRQASSGGLRKFATALPACAEGVARWRGSIQNVRPSERDSTTMREE